MNNKKEINIVFVGCGRVANHYKNLINSNNLKNFKVIGVCDVNLDKAKKFAKDFSEKFFENLEEMLNQKKIDLAIICSPSGMHYSHASILINKGINVLVEKPLTLTIHQSAKLEIMAKENKVLLNVAFQNRFNPAVQILKKNFLEGRFGKIVTSTIRLRWCRYQEYYNDEWHGKWASDGGVINQQAIHHIDALNWIVGPVEKVCAISTNRLNQLEAEDTLVAILKLKDGGLGTIEATTAARPEDFEASISVVGEKGMVEIGGIALNQIKTWKFIDKIDTDSNVIQKYSQDVPTGYGLSHITLLQKIIDSLLKEEKKNIISAKETILSTKLIHALYKSDETKKWVLLSDEPISQRLGMDN
jgi:predicted dehydrogenase|tara:strand:+ start:130 stop:1206 length:1077 start_codon:yes stop_codon:yes gene_type:complete